MSSCSGMKSNLEITYQVNKVSCSTTMCVTGFEKHIDAEIGVVYLNPRSPDMIDEVDLLKSAGMNSSYVNNNDKFAEIKGKPSPMHNKGEPSESDVKSMMRALPINVNNNVDLLK